MTSTTMISFGPKAVTVAVLALGLGLAACKTTPPPKPTAAQLTGEQLHALYTVSYTHLTLPTTSPV